MKNYNKLNEIKGIKSVCILTHIQPDADALCSAVVLRDFLINNFGVSKVDLFAECSNLPENYNPILEDIKLNPNTSKYNLSIMIDCPNSSRLGIYKELFKSAKHKIVIDHHSTNNFEGEINFVENVSSTCEIIYSILKHFKIKISTKNQGKLYAGIITDTNNFTVGNITHKTLKIASEFSKNINREAIYNNFLSNNTLKNMQLLSLAIQNTVSFDHGQILISHITHEEAHKFKASFEDYYGIINSLATINSAKYICFIKPINNIYYVGLRARKGADVSVIAKENGGGGHIGAAAFESDKTLQEIEQLILTSFRRELSKLKPIETKIF